MKITEKGERRYERMQYMRNKRNDRIEGEKKKIMYMMFAYICKYVLRLLCIQRSFPLRTLLPLIHLQRRALTGNYHPVTQPKRGIVRKKGRKKESKTGIKEEDEEST
jgi:hypothetical protein